VLGTLLTPDTFQIVLNRFLGDIRATHHLWDSTRWSLLASVK
jgi:hypothetical protein